jgi:chemotaxis protein methyltransferase CheR
MSEENEVKIQDVNYLTAAVKRKYNFDFSDYAISSFLRRIDRFLEVYQFSSIPQLSERLLADKALFELFLKEITVNTTEMFRDPDCWKILKDKIFPLIEKFPTIRIWHSACSSGEEVFSMAIALKEAGLYDKSKIFASDINEDVIAKAITGRYSVRHMELNDANYKKSEGTHTLSNYYKREGDYIHMDLSLLKNVTFKKFDLVQGEQYLKFDLILCRNVLIYFNFPLQDKVVAKFSTQLVQDGFLVLGSKETISFCKSAEHYELFSHEQKVFRRI